MFSPQRLSNNIKAGAERVLDKLPNSGNSSDKLGFDGELPLPIDLEPFASPWGDLGQYNSHTIEGLTWRIIKIN